uniref:Uncharacterized protein n=1 Tax=Ciona savignyi TaxID=51511 RepID=H2YLJ2_CIOSA
MSNLVIHFAPEAILLLCTISYFVISNYILGYNVLITSPLQTTMIFCLGYTIIQFLVLRYMWPRAKALSEDNQMSKKSGFAKSWIKSFLVVLSCWFLAHGLCVLFGAAAFSLVEETATWAILVTCLIAIPALSMMGCDVPA